MHLNFFFNRGIIANLGPTKFEQLIDNQVVHNFTLPNHEKTNVHNRNNWLYELEVKVSLPHHLTILSLMKIKMPISLMLLHTSLVLIVLIPPLISTLLSMLL